MNRTTLKPLFNVLTTISKSIEAPDGCCFTISLSGTDIEIRHHKTERDSPYCVSSATRLFGDLTIRMNRRIKAVGITEFAKKRKYHLLPWPKQDHRYYSEIEVSSVWRCDHRTYIRPVDPYKIGEARPLDDVIRLYNGQFTIDYNLISMLKFDFSDFLENPAEANKQMLLLQKNTLR